jgi:hypothetical protein
MLILKLILAWGISACSSPVAPSNTQRLRIEAGDAGIVDRGRIVAIDFVRFSEEPPRYDLATSLLAQEWLKNRSQNLTEFLQEALGEVSKGLASEIETEIRSRNCIYSVELQEKIVKELVLDSLSSRTESAAEDIFDVITDAELAALEKLSDEEFDQEVERLTQKYAQSDNQSAASNNVIGIASQCLFNTKVGDQVTVVKFEDFTSISPILAVDSYAAN